MKWTAEFADGSALTVDDNDPTRPQINPRGLPIDRSQAADASLQWALWQDTDAWPYTHARQDFQPEHIPHYLASFPDSEVSPPPPPVPNDPNVLY